MKITVVGGGSTYTPELADGLGRLAPWVTELVLVDPDQTRLAAVGPVSARIMRRHGHPAVVRWTDNLDDALDGAAAVLIQLRVGGQAARNRDETWPLDYDCVGQETTGAGGLAKALRTVPLVLDIAEQARRRALPGAWIIDFTNPVGIVTRALLDAGHRAVGLCNVAIGLQRYFASVLGTDPARVSLDHAGLNHLTWLRGVQVDGKELLPELLTAHGDEIADHAGHAAVGAARPGRRPLLLPPLFLLPRRGGRRGAGAAEPGGGGRRDRARAHGAVRRPRPRPQARAAVQARRGLLLGGGRRADRVAVRRRPRGLAAPRSRS